ncbi:hypothetical protein E4U31_001090 [Claviceps sp. LM219 group G6]|nr:hypothetical protein E4U31_001090 [Claviceps sp. LM219 group G6]
MVRKLPGFQNKIVDILVNIQKASDPANHIASILGYQPYRTEFAFDFKVPRWNDPEWETKRQAWINMKVFCAEISKSRIPQLDERTRASNVERADKFHGSNELLVDGMPAGRVDDVKLPRHSHR